MLCLCNNFNVWCFRCRRSIAVKTELKNFAGVVVDALIENKLLKYTHVLTGYVGSPSFLKKVGEVINNVRNDNPDVLYGKHLELIKIQHCLTKILQNIFYEICSCVTFAIVLSLYGTFAA